eukprot:SAG31_NODE_1607_length_7760_cov_3.640386_2_plen_319_part_00
MCNNLAIMITQVLADRGMVDDAKLVVEAGGVVDQFDRSGRTGLHRAATEGDLESMQLWVSLGAKVDLPVMQKGAQTALMLAAQSPFPADCVHFLVQSGASVNAVDSTGNTVLKLLLDAGETTTAEYCVRRGASFDTLVSSLEPQTARMFEKLFREWEEEERRRLSLAESLVAEAGAQALATADNCITAGHLYIKGTTRWNRRFLVLSRGIETSVMLHRFATDVALEPLQSSSLEPAVCAVEKAEGTSSAPWGMNVSNFRSTKDVAASGGQKSRKTGFGSTFGKLAAIAHVCLYCVMVDHHTPQCCQLSLLQCVLVFRT